MGRTVDNLIALKILKMLVTQFVDTDAYKLGIIDATGKNIRKANSLQTAKEKDAYSYLTRLVFNIKKIINRLPGGENNIKSLVAALWLIKEQYQSNNKLTNSLLEEKFADLMKLMDNRVSLVEEEIIVKKFLKEDAVANVTGAAVSTNEPKIHSKDIKKYKQGQSSTISGMVRRPNPLVK
jgi:hypothetical protein